MEMMMQSSHEIADWRQPLWLATLAAASVATSLGLACAVPLAAFAALGALTLDRRSALVMIVMVVLANQIIGFTVLHYPRDLPTFAWAAAFVLAGLLATSAALWMKNRFARFNPLLGVAATFLTAFAAYEGTFFIISLACQSALYAYSPPIVLRVFEVNIAVFAGLLLIDRVALSVGLLKPVLRA
jgi:uncharacterized membrane protein